MNRFVSRGLGAMRAFWRASRGTVAVETALAIPVLVFALAGLIEIVHSAYVSDSMSRGARAAARAVALAPEAATGSGTLGTVACTAIRRELRLADDFDCGASWTLTVDTKLTPTALANGGEATDGDMVLVRIAWNWELGKLISSLNDDDGPHRRIAVGVARREPGTGS